MTENQFMAEILRKEIKELKEKSESIMNDMQVLEENDGNVQVFAGLLASPGVKEYVGKINELDDVLTSIKHKQNGFRYNLKSSCTHPAYLYQGTSGDNWVCSCLACKNTLFRLPEDCIGKTLVTPTLYEDNVSLESLSNEYLDLYEESGDTFATDIMIKRYNRINHKRKF